MENNDQKGISQGENHATNGSGSVPAGLIVPKVLARIKKKRPSILPHQKISKAELRQFMEEYLRELISTEKGRYTKLDREVVKSMVDQESIAKNINVELEHRYTRGERIADKIAEFGGSWNFLFMFAGVLFLWVFINSLVFLWRPFDPFPFILLNLFLSCLAAVQAPVIMMSQNRKESRDRLRAEEDYKINLKAELEIRSLHDKLDNLMQNEWARLLQIQQTQIDLLEKGQKSEDSPT